MNKMLDAALGYAKRGWPIFPCRADKTPYTKNGVLDATTNIAQIEDWWAEYPGAGIGLDVTGAGLMVLDYDPGSDRREVERSVGDLPKTGLTQRTPRGGLHEFYEVRQGELVANSVSKIAPKVDVRGFNGYVLLPPSRTNDGSYSWESNGRPAYRSDDLLRAANVAREKSQDRDEWIIKPDLPENVERCIAWLTKDAKIAIEGQGGDATAYATAAMCKSFGISPELALDLMWQHWNPRCVPPWSSDEWDHFERKVENGYSYNTSPPGNVTDAYRAARQAQLFKPVERRDLPSGREVTAGRFRFVDREGMGHIRPPSWLVRDAIPVESYCLMHGAPGTFKTFLALDMALTVATGGNWPWQGCWTAEESGPVLFSVGEGRAGISHRVQAWEKVHLGGKRASNFFLADPVPNITEDLEPFLDGALELSPNGYRLVVIDTVGRAMQGTNENAQEYASQFTRMVETLIREFGCAVLALHHEGVESGRARGSTVFVGDPDVILRVERQEKATTVSVSGVKNKDGPELQRRWIKLAAVQLDHGADSLVAARPADPEKASIEARPKVERKTDRRAAETPTAVLDVVEQVLLETLASNKLLDWSNNKLADAIACHARVEVGSSQLRQNLLRVLREDNNRAASKAYDPIKQRWRHIS